MKRKQGCGILTEMALTHFRVSIFLDFITLSLDELTMEVVLFANDGERDNEEVIGLTSTSS